jgi:fibronectin type 3 domain-containing protein
VCAPAPGARAHGEDATALAAAAATGGDPYVAAVGDMGCSQWDPDYNNGNGTATRCRQKYVSDLLVNPVPDALLLLGDNQYDEGQLDEFQEVYHPTFGRANTAAYPSLGNAEYDTTGAQGYFDYFSSVGVSGRIGAMAGADASHYSSGYYSFDVGAWHLVALNSNCAQVGGCNTGSPQELWLKSDLAAHPNQCTLAYWHHPRWNSGTLGDDPATRGFWTDLYAAKADVVLNGHGNHHYERFMPQNANGAPDPANGVREFIVSTGGEAHGTPPGSPTDSIDTTEISDYTSFGILRLSLRPASYTWQFVPAVGGSFTDSGSGTCHSAPAAQAPSAPTSSASADSAVHVSWNVPSDGGAQITGYKLYRGTAAGGETLYKTLGNVTSYDDSVVDGGTKYYYRVAAVNSVGDGAQSNEVSATPTAPPPAAFPGTPVLDDFARAAGPLGSSWSSPGLADAGTLSIQAGGLTKSSAGASSATWSAQRFGADQEAYLTLPTLPKAGQFLQVAGRVSTLAAATVSCYFLRVTPSTGVWDLRRKVNGGASASIKTFSAPFAAGDGAGLRIAGSTITAYRKPAAGAWTALGSAPDTAITAGGYLSFTLSDTTARGGAFGGGPASAPLQRPAAPALTATADTAVHLSWNAPTDGGAPITAYNLYRGTAAGATSLYKSLSDVTSYDDTTVTGGTNYYYRVAAVNGVGEGAQSAEASATPAVPVQPPAAPVLSATADTAAHLTWSAPANGGAPITAYKLYRGTATGATTLYQNLGNVTSYDDAAVTGGTKYFYRVAAVNSIGEGSPSSEASATPASAPPPPLPFPRTATLDGFARPTGALGTSWQTPGLGDPGTVSIKSSGLTGSSAGASSATWRTQTFTPDQEAFMTVPTLPGGANFIQLATRVSGLTPANLSCYFLRVTPSAGKWDLRKKLNGAGSTSIKTFTAPFAAGDSAGLQVIGSTLTAYRKAGAWTSVGSVTDTAIPAAGYVSFTLGDTTVRGGAFGGGSIN